LDGEAQALLNAKSICADYDDIQLEPAPHTHQEFAKFAAMHDELVKLASRDADSTGRLIL
jgi:hypothetical protein